MTIQQITEASEKSAICADILHALPNWFGNAEANAGFIRDVRRMPFFAALENEVAIGFIALDLLDEHSGGKCTAEVHVMGVPPEHHRQGVGRQLIAQCELFCRSQGIPVMQVKTLADTHPSKSYAKTRMFYKSLGFTEQKITEEWGKEEQCLHMVKEVAA